MRIAVTGATGHLGANVVRDLLRHKHQVRALCHPDANRSALDGLAVESVAADVLVPESILNAFRRVDAVIHLTAIISVNGDPGGLVMRTNVEGTRNVANACLKTGLKNLFMSVQFMLSRAPGLPEKSTN